MKYLKPFSLNEEVRNNIKVNRYVYHASHISNRTRITKNGIVPHRGVQWLNDTNISGKAVFATNSDNSKDWFNSTWDDDVWRIDTQKIPNIKWLTDPNFHDIKNNKHIYTNSKIPKEAIELVKIGTGKDLINENLNFKTILNESISNRSEYLNNAVIIDIFQEVIDMGHDVIIEDIIYEEKNPINIMHMRGFRRDFKVMFTSKLEIDNIIRKLPLFRKGILISIGCNDKEQVLKNLMNTKWSVYKNNHKLFDKVTNKLKLQFDFITQESKSDIKYIIKSGPFKIEDVELHDLIKYLKRHAEEIL